MTPHEAKADLALRSRELGVDLVKVTPASVPGHYGAAFREWVGDGYEADMGYLTQRVESGVQVSDLLAGVRSVVCLGVNYWRGPEDGPVPSGSGQVSRYAVSRDYHKTIGRIVKTLARHIEDELGGAARGFVDIGPILERAHAEVGGMGYIGKNTMLISPEHGSWIFLAALLTDLDLPPDLEPVHLRCGTCTRCIDVCPTAAILPDRRVDASRCISYLTIENRGPIPEDLRAGIGNWLFGCDLCQEVCPHNGGLTPTRVEDFRSVRIADRQLDLAEILGIPDDDAYTARFAGTPLMRAKRRGLLRNACVVAGNSGDPGLLPALSALLDRETDELLLEHATWATKKIQN